MEFTMTASGNSDPIRLNQDEASFKISVIGICNAGFNGTYKIQYSPNNIDWIDHEVAVNLVTSGCNNLFFPVPWMRIVLAGLSAGSLTVHIFGSIH